VGGAAPPAIVSPAPGGPAGPAGVTRRALLTAGAVALGALASGRVAAGSRPARSDLLGRSRGRRLVVVGASFGGITAARTVKRLVPDAEVVLLEQSSYFVFAPAALEYLFGRIPLDRIVRGFGGIEAGGLRLLHTTVVAVERDRRQLVTTDGSLDYDQLLLATGLRLAYEDVPGLAERPDVNLCPYDTGAALLELRRRIGAFRGGHVVVSTPQSLYKCAPAPYEYALLWAEHIKRRRLPGRVTLVESRSRPPAALAPGLLRALEANKAVLAYEPFTRVLSVDPAARVVETEAGKLRFDLLGVVPPNTAVPFVAQAELGEVLVDVDPRTFRSSRDERIHAVGDTADTPYAKTAHTAVMSGRIAGHHIARALDARVGDGGPRPGAPNNVCFPMVAADRALRLGTDWYFENDEAGVPQVKVAGSADNEASARNLRLREEWQGWILRELLG
jgi:NADPH-dependent 2,4-dienoyl-CoA reductase/sulfur reductase-like enzyme